MNSDCEFVVGQFDNVRRDFNGGQRHCWTPPALRWGYVAVAAAQAAQEEADEQRNKEHRRKGFVEAR